MTSRVLVVGGGRVGTALVGMLLDSGREVAVVDDRPSVVARLRARFGSEIVHEGQPADVGTLEVAGVRTVDVLAAVTAIDARNVVVASLARYHFGVPRTVARIVDPAHAWMYTPEMGVDVALDQADLIARLVAEEMSLGDMTVLMGLRRGQYELVEERVHPDAAVVGKRLGGLAVPDECVVVAVLREGAPILHDADVVLRPEDEVLAVVHVDALDELATLLGRPADATGSRGF